MTTTEQDRKRTRSGDMATAGSRQNRIATRTDTEGGLLRQERTLTRKITGPPQDRTGLRHIRTVIRTVPLITTAQDHNRTGPARPGLRQKKATTGQVHRTGPQSFRTATGRDCDHDHDRAGPAQDKIRGQGHSRTATGQDRDQDRCRRGLLRQEMAVTRKITGPPQDRTRMRHIRTSIVSEHKRKKLRDHRGQRRTRKGDRVTTAGQLQD